MSDEISVLKEKLEIVQRALHDLTPGGSEYYHNTKACVNYIRNRFNTDAESVKSQARRAKKAEDELKSKNERKE